ncbi:hypothetical protein DM860_016787 [Cuscuta australis]|uniref:Uncharacterized protein n=1 Tax=Cuscuta australis TaxID=267555 RepID=A0A328E0N8_9ASTE|nr:hypothetical protein DM860_016787 [Cuscuta australis]
MLENSYRHGSVKALSLLHPLHFLSFLLGLGQGAHLFVDSSRKELSNANPATTLLQLSSSLVAEMRKTISCTEIFGNLIRRVAKFSVKSKDEASLLPSPETNPRRVLPCHGVKEVKRVLVMESRQS